MKIFPTFTLALLSAVLPAFAADCGTKNMGKPDSATTQRFWNTRSSTCTCLQNNPGSFCSPSSQFSAFAMWGTHPTVQLCWDAYEDIINQCILNGWNSGLYQASGTSFQITRYK